MARVADRVRRSRSTHYRRVFAVIAAVVYLLAVRSALNYIRDRIETVYEVASRIKEGYDWLSDKFSFLSFLRRSR